MGSQQRTDFEFQSYIAIARLMNECPAVVRLHLEGALQQLVNLFPLLTIHADATSQLVISRYNQALALAQSRITVTAEILRASAVSSTLSPPK